MTFRRPDRDPERPVYVISVAASIVSVHPRTLRIYEDEGLICPARTPTNIRLYSENDIRRVIWIRHLTQNRGVNLAGVRILFELEERLGTGSWSASTTREPVGRGAAEPAPRHRHRGRPARRSREPGPTAGRLGRQADPDPRPVGEPMAEASVQPDDERTITSPSCRSSRSARPSSSRR